MPKYTIANARLIAVNYGPKRSPSEIGQLQTVAQKLDPGGGIQTALNTVIDWESEEFADEEMAMSAVRQHVAGEVSRELGVEVTLPGWPDFYMPIFNKLGQLVGHEVIPYYEENGETRGYEEHDDRGQLVIGMYACVYLAIREVK